MSKHYLVTGGAGFIGSHLAEALIARGNRVTIIDDFSSGNQGNLSPISNQVRLLEGDFRDIGKLAANIEAIDTVIHLAALISGYDSLNDPLAYQRINVLGMHDLIEFVRARQIPRIVFASSSTVYGNQSKPLMSETTLPQPASVYALGKLAGEHLLTMFGQLHGFEHCSLRLFNVYGPRQAVDHPYANVTCKFSHAAANGLPVLRYGDGMQSRDFVFVADVVAAFLAVLDGSPATLYNVGTGKDRSINDLLTVLAAIAGSPLIVEDRPPWPNDIRQIRADTARFLGDFGFSPSTGLTEGLARTVESFRS